MTEAVPCLCSGSLVCLFARLGGEAQSLFQALAKEERKHKLQLETEYDDEILTEN